MRFMGGWAETGLRRILVNSAAIFGGEAISRMGAFAMGLIVAHRFGAAGFGQYGYALAVASVLLVFPDFGLHLLTTRELATDPERLRRIFWSLHWVKFFMVGGVLFFAFLLGEEAVRDGGRRLLLYVLVARAALMTFSQAYMAIFKAFERMHYIALQQLVNAAVALICAAIALALRMNLGVMVSCLVIGQAADTYIGWRIVRRRFGTGSVYGWDSAFSCAMLWAAAPIGITTILQAANLRMDILTLSIFASNSEVGRFQAGSWFLVGTFLFASLVMGVIFPKLCRLLHHPSERGSVYIASLLKHGTIFVTVGSLAVWLAAPRVLLWLYGAQFVNAASLLRILAPAIPFMFINTVLVYVFVAARLRAVYLGTLGLSFGLGVILCLFLVRSYGASGAALADLIREFVVAAVFLVHLKRHDLAAGASGALLKISLGIAALTLMLCAFGGSPGPQTVWTAACDVLMLGGTLIFAGFPSRQELSLILGENL